MGRFHEWEHTMEDPRTEEVKQAKRHYNVWVGYTIEKPDFSGFERWGNIEGAVGGQGKVMRMGGRWLEMEFAFL